MSKSGAATAFRVVRTLRRRLRWSASRTSVTFVAPAARELERGRYEPIAPVPEQQRVALRQRSRSSGRTTTRYGGPEHSTWLGTRAPDRRLLPHGWRDARLGGAQGCTQERAARFDAAARQSIGLHRGRLADWTVRRIAPRDRVGRNAPLLRNESAQDGDGRGDGDTPHGVG